jgi:16S rRNA G966 N2-methylase RsmD
VFKFLESSNQKFSVIFADPPYNFDLELFSKIPELVFSNNLLEDDGVLIVEHSKHTNLSGLGNYSHSKSYGGNVFSFFELPTED